MRNRVGIIGCGNMGLALCERLKSAYNLCSFDKDANKTNQLSNIEVVSNAADLVAKSDVVILAVKPQDFDALLKEIKEGGVSEKLIVSIAAGISTEYIQRYLDDIRIIRVMPNMPAKIGKGISCLCNGKFATQEDLNFAEEIFKKLGAVLILNEDMVDAATAISGSGPGYFYYLVENKDKNEIKEFANKVFMPNLTTSAENIGFSQEEAKALAEATTVGSIALIEETNLSPAELKKQITSKGGTTEAGIEVLSKEGSLEEAVKTALKRAKELSRR